MDKKKLMLLLGALVVAIGTAMAAKSLFTGAATPQAQAAQPVPQGPKVLVAQRALPVGTIITADSISFQAWPQEMVQDAYFIDGEADMNKLLGTVVRYPITAGQPVTQGALVSPGDRGFLAAALGPGMRAVIGLGYKGPELYIGNLISKRTDAIRKGLPDALDLLVICAEAGLTVDASFNRVARELGRAYPELGDEFALTAIELSFLSERRQAFENLAWRVNLEAVKGVTTTMVQTERYGTPLASALRVLSAEFRNERMMRAEEKAARLPAIMTVPLILFILPVLFVVILGPAACSIADAFSANGPTNGGG